MRRLFSALLSGLFFIGQVVLAHSQETHLWEQRQQAVQRQQKKESNAIGELASASLIGSRLPTAMSAIRSLPAELQTGLGQKKVSSELSTLISLFSADGVVRDVRPSSRASAPTVVLLEDVHDHKEAQERLSGMILKAAEFAPGLALGLEGASGSLRVNQLRTGDNESDAEAASFFLNVGYIGGPEYAAIASPIAIKAGGLEDEVLYRKNIEALKWALPQQKKVLGSLAEKKRALAQEKKKAYSTELMSLDQKMVAYAEGTTALGEYASYLTKVQSKALSSFPSVSAFLDCWAMEKTLDFAAAERQRNNFLGELVSKLDKAALNRLTEQSVAFRSGFITYPQYYSLLKETGLRAGLPFSRFPVFESYVRYILKTDSIKPAVLLGEIAKLETDAFAFLCRTAEQKKVAAMARNLTRAEKLARLQLTPDEWSAYEPVQDLNVSSFEDFYRLAEARNHALAKNALALTPEAGDSRGSSLTLIVAGGFHSEGVKRLITADRANLLIVSPKLTSIPEGDGEAYFSVFTRGRIPVDRLFKAPVVSLKDPLSSQSAYFRQLIAAVGNALRLSYSTARPASAPILDEEGKPTGSIARYTPADADEEAGGDVVVAEGTTNKGGKVELVGPANYSLLTNRRMIWITRSLVAGQLFPYVSRFISEGIVNRFFPVVFDYLPSSLQFLRFEGVADLSGLWIAVIVGVLLFSIALSFVLNYQEKIMFDGWRAIDSKKLLDYYKLNEADKTKFHDPNKSADSEEDVKQTGYGKMIGLVTDKLIRRGWIHSDAAKFADRQKKFQLPADINISINLDLGMQAETEGKNKIARQNESTFAQFDKKTNTLILSPYAAFLIIWDTRSLEEMPILIGGQDSPLRNKLIANRDYNVDTLILHEGLRYHMRNVPRIFGLQTFLLFIRRAVIQLRTFLQTPTNYNVSRDMESTRKSEALEDLERAEQLFNQKQYERADEALISLKRRDYQLLPEHRGRYNLLKGQLDKALVALRSQRQQEQQNERVVELFGRARDAFDDNRHKDVFRLLEELAAFPAPDLIPIIKKGRSLLRRIEGRRGGNEEGVTNVAFQTDPESVFRDKLRQAEVHEQLARSQEDEGNLTIVPPAATRKQEPVDLGLAAPAPAPAVPGGVLMKGVPGEVASQLTQVIYDVEQSERVGDRLMMNAVDVYVDLNRGPSPELAAQLEILRKKIVERATQIANREITGNAIAVISQIMKTLSGAFDVTQKLGGASGRYVDIGLVTTILQEKFRKALEEGVADARRKFEAAGAEAGARALAQLRQVAGNFLPPVARDSSAAIEFEKLEGEIAQALKPAAPVKLKPIEALQAALEKLNDSRQVGDAAMIEAAHLYVSLQNRFPLYTDEGSLHAELRTRIFAQSDRILNDYAFAGRGNFEYLRNRVANLKGINDVLAIVQIARLRGLKTGVISSILLEINSAVTSAKSDLRGTSNRAGARKTADTLRAILDEAGATAELAEAYLTLDGWLRSMRTGQEKDTSSKKGRPVFSGKVQLSAGEEPLNILVAADLASFEFRVVTDKGTFEPFKNGSIYSLITLEFGPRGDSFKYKLEFRIDSPTARLNGVEFPFKVSYVNTNQEGGRWFKRDWYDAKGHGVETIVAPLIVPFLVILSYLLYFPFADPFMILIAAYLSAPIFEWLFHLFRGEPSYLLRPDAIRVSIWTAVAELPLLIGLYSPLLAVLGLAVTLTILLLKHRDLNGLNDLSRDVTDRVLKDPVPHLSDGLMTAYSAVASLPADQQEPVRALLARLQTDALIHVSGALQQQAALALDPHVDPRTLTRPSASTPVADITALRILAQIKVAAENTTAPSRWSEMSNLTRLLGRYTDDRAAALTLVRAVAARLNLPARDLRRIGDRYRDGRMDQASVRKKSYVTPDYAKAEYQGKSLPQMHIQSFSIDDALYPETSTEERLETLKRHLEMQFRPGAPARSNPDVLFVHKRFAEQSDADAIQEARAALINLMPKGGNALTGYLDGVKWRVLNPDEVALHPLQIRAMAIEASTEQGDDRGFFVQLYAVSNRLIDVASLTPDQQFAFYLLEGVRALRVLEMRIQQDKLDRVSETYA